MPTFVVAEIVPVEVPPLRLKTMVDPPVVKLLPAASRAVRVRVAVEPEVTVPLETLTKEVAALITPGLTVTVGIVEVTALPPIVDAIVVADPLTKPVNVAV